MQDMTRAIAPLKQAEDAVLLDTSSMTLAQVVEEILKIKYNNGQEELKFNYDLTSERKIPTRWVVTTSTDGKIKRVYSTK